MQFRKESKKYVADVQIAITDDQTTFAAMVMYTASTGQSLYKKFEHSVSHNTVFSIAPLIKDIEEFISERNSKDKEYEKRYEQAKVHLNFYGFKKGK